MVLPPSKWSYSAEFARETDTQGELFCSNSYREAAVPSAGSRVTYLWIGAGRRLCLRVEDEGRAVRAPESGCMFPRKRTTCRGGCICAPGTSTSVSAQLRERQARVRAALISRSSPLAWPCLIPASWIICTNPRTCPYPILFIMPFEEARERRSWLELGPGYRLSG